VNESLLFIILALTLLVLVVGFFWAALKSAVFKSRPLQYDPKEAVIANVAVYREHLAELAAEFELGRLSEHEFELAREELAQRLMEDSKAHTQGISHVSTQEFRNKDAFDPSDSAAFASKRAQSPWIRWTLPALAVLIPALSISLYFLVGTPLALDYVETEQVAHDETFTPEKLAQMAQELNARLKQEPNNADGWVMLARVERSLSHFESAEKALTKALSLSQNDDVEIERAEVLAQINHGSFKGEPWAIILKVLKANPDQGNALLLAGSAAFTEEHYSDALKYWQRVQKLVPPDSADGAALADAIGKAQERLGVKPNLQTQQSVSPQSADANTAAAQSAQSNSAKSGAQTVKARLIGRVEISSSLASKIHPSDTVFIYAVPVSGSRMPLAMIKTTVAQMPYDFVLDDSNAMNPAANLSSVSEVMIKARISASGNAMPQPGDFAVTKGPVKVGTQNLRLMIAEPLN
jgi:cytochrome c-type biogenesis protein CcmH